MRASVLILAAAVVVSACSGTVRRVGRASPSSSPTTGTAAPVRASSEPSVPGLVWTPSRLPLSLIRVAEGLSAAEAVVTVGNGTVWLRGGAGTPAGMAIPVDVSAADPRRYAAAVPAAPPVLRRLGTGDVLLSADSARLRRLHVGDRTALGHVVLRVAGIVADSVIGNAEMFVTAADGRRLGVPANRYILVLPRRASGWPGIVSILRRAVGPGIQTRLRAPGTARALREADAVLSPLEEKLRFGEFAADPHATAAGYLTIDPRWRAAHLVTAVVPILGAVTCNRAFIRSLRAALRAVVRQGLQRLVHRNDYGGCYAPRLIPGQPGQSISHHAFGSAIDLNVQANPQGRPPRQDPRLVRTLARFGLTWGGRWLVPDGMHFEALG